MQAGILNIAAKSLRLPVIWRKFCEKVSKLAHKKLMSVFEKRHFGTTESAFFNEFRPFLTRLFHQGIFSRLEQLLFYVINWHLLTCPNLKCFCTLPQHHAQSVQRFTTRRFSDFKKLCFPWNIYNI
jgi:hypothetical protein